ncbi:MAG: hypothetical protein U2P89_05035 [Proteiniphilum sp.]|jgi:hypothetical protein|uniref:hypothetical protein n=1 Tax=Proteiniphilum sp. TaxID=1926877 RepID=UPI002AB9B4B3|nr:hypothetical protein [Proteiniphilum sp.]MDY9918222.1 hypothetical protein [Proteiniphilum sp.]
METIDALQEKKTRTLPDDSGNWDEPEYEEYIEQITRRIRHDNRFAYFAMRFIDEMNGVNSLRFHIDLGKLELANYDKLLAGKEVPRRVAENVKVFGKLSDYPDETTAYHSIDTRQYTSGFIQFALHYNVKNNKR